LGASLVWVEFYGEVNVMATEFNVAGASLHMEQDSFAEPFPWYGIRTRSNHERVAATVLSGKGYDPYLPVYRLRRRRADAVVESEHPLFPGYVFCRFDATKRLPILMTTGVISVVGFGREPAAIPDEEIEAVKAVLRSGLPAEPCEYLREGQRVRVTMVRLMAWRESSSRRKTSLGWLSP
jgi:transcription antitermination factor NusG